VGFEPTMADLQSAALGHLATPPNKSEDRSRPPVKMPPNEPDQAVGYTGIGTRCQSKMQQDRKTHEFTDEPGVGLIQADPVGDGGCGIQKKGLASEEDETTRAPRVDRNSFWILYPSPPCLATSPNFLELRNSPCQTFRCQRVCVCCSDIITPEGGGRFRGKFIKIKIA
jgi:hypothetical protein